MSWLASTAATATSLGTPNDTSTAERPPVPTAVPPPGIGTIEAMVTTPTLAASRAQNETWPPNATRHSARHQVDITLASTLPKIRSARWLGDRNASHIVAQARRNCGTTRARTPGTHATTALETA